MRAPLFLLLLLLSLSAAAQKMKPKVEMLTAGTKASLRGLSVVNDQVIWVSGSGGTVGRTTNGGKEWKWLTVKGFEDRDFRDVQGFDGTNAVIMAVGEPAYILRTIDGGAHWKVVYENTAKGMFLDAMEFWNEEAGIVLGDPVNGRFFVARTFNGGASWEELPTDRRPLADSGEACFAASGTNIAVLDLDEAVFVSGGLRSRIFIRNSPLDLPIIQGKETTGANSVDVWDRHKRKGGKRILVVGGDFNQPASTTLNCFYSRDRGRTWKAPKTPPSGYRSAVAFLEKRQAVACGLTGVDYTYDGGRTWTKISDTSFHAVRIARAGRSVYFSGGNGRIGRLVLPRRGS